MRFVRLSDAGPGEATVLRRSVVRIGSLEENDLRILAPEVAPVHAKILEEEGRFVLYDNEDEFGTYVNGRRVDSVELKSGDEIRLGDRGPAFRFEAEATAGEETIVRSAGTVVRAPSDPRRELGSLAMRAAREFALDRPLLRIGRDPGNDLVLAHPQVSAFHAELRESGGRHLVEDLRSRNGTFVNGSRVSRRKLSPQDAVHIGPFVLLTTSGRLQIYDETRRADIAVERISTRAPRGGPLLLEDVSLSIGTGELVGILGPSGAGKSTLLRAMCGLRPPAEGRVSLNDLDLYENYERLKQHLGFVPQDDIVHQELSAQRTFEYVARLRLPPDLRAEERSAKIRDLLSLLELQGREHLPVRRLSGGQRKRVSLGVELLTEPQLIFLDEPTAGLDPALESKMMVLFKELSRQGRTVVVTTHLMENVELFDKLIVLVRGKLAFFGTPAEAREHFGIADLRGLFSRLGPRSPEEWRGRSLPSAPAEPPASRTTVRHRIGGLWAALRQWAILCRRYGEILVRDRRNLTILLLQAPLVAIFIYVAMDNVASILFMLTLAAIWFGTSNAAKEIVKELSIYRRERMFNLGLLPYVGSKVAILFAVSLVQCVLLVGVVRVLRPLEGNLAMIFGGVLLTSMVGVLLGLLISAFVGSTDKAVSTVPLVLIPQVLFAGAFTPLTGGAGIVSLGMPSRWSFALLKRVVLETHREAKPPLVTTAQKRETELELAKLEKESRDLLEKIDGHVERFSESRRRMEEQWREFEVEIRRLEQQERAIRGSHDRVRAEFLRLEVRRREVEGAIRRHREVLLDLQKEMKEMQEELQSERPDPKRLLERMTPEWLEKKRKGMRELVETFDKLHSTATEVQHSQERLAREMDQIGVRMQEAARSGAVLRSGRFRMEREVSEVRALVEDTVRLEKSLKERTERMRLLQEEMMENLRAGKFVFLDPRDSLRRNSMVLAAFCVVFLMGIAGLQARRDREG